MKKAFHHMTCGVLVSASILVGVSLSAQAADQSSKSPGMGTQMMTKLCAAQYAVLGQATHTASRQAQSQIASWVQACSNKPYSSGHPCDHGKNVKYDAGKHLCTVDQFLCISDQYGNSVATDATFPVFWDPSNPKAGVKCS